MTLVGACGGRRRNVVIPPVDPPPDDPPDELGPFVPLPAQPFSISYGIPTTGITGQYARPGGLVLARKQDMGHQVFKDVSAGGGTVLGYIDPIIHRTDDYYADMLFSNNSRGGNVGTWPGRPSNVNEWGPLSDFRASSVMHQPSADRPGLTKWQSVLTQMLEDHPHLGGFFFDDTGTRSNFSGAPWSGFSGSDQTEYRNGAIKLVQDARVVANAHGVIIIVNGTWEGGPLSTHGGGYPTSTDHGCSLAEGMLIESHDPNDFWLAMVAAPQWATAALSGGERFMLVTAETSAGRTAWKAADVAYVSQQIYGDSYNEAAPWGPGHANGLPSHAS